MADIGTSRGRNAAVAFLGTAVAPQYFAVHPAAISPPSRDRRPAKFVGNRAAPANWFTSASQPHPAAYPPAYQPHSAAYPPAYPPYQPAFPPYTPATNPQLLPIQIHPWLNGDLPSSDLLFDLSVTAFAPKRRINAEQAVDLTQADFLVPAFHPPLTKLHIVCDMLPHWPIDLVYPYGYTAQAPPITVGDVLIVIHQKLHQRISHTEWGRLSMSEETAVSRAFTHRCRKEAIRTQGGFMSDLELPERSQGVKVVDFLHGRNHFRGLVRADDGSVRLLVA